MNDYTLNIGRQRNDCAELLSWDEVRKALSDRQLHVMDMVIRQSATEETFVVLVRDSLNPLPYVRHRLTGLAADLHQDCIAGILSWVRHPTETGDFAGVGVPGGGLFGPDVAKWAPYNPEYFLTFC